MQPLTSPPPAATVVTAEQQQPSPAPSASPVSRPKGKAQPLASDHAEVDVLVVGGGVCGTALLFELARYTDLQIGRAHV